MIIIFVSYYEYSTHDLMMMKMMWEWVEICRSSLENIFFFFVLCVRIFIKIVVKKDFFFNLNFEITKIENKVLRQNLDGSI